MLWIMKTLSLILSVAVFLVAGYYFVIDFQMSGEVNYLLYMSLLVVLMLICVVGFLINIPFIVREKRKMNVMMQKRFGRKGEAPRLDFNFET